MNSIINLDLITYNNYVHWPKEKSLKIKILKTMGLVKMYIKHQELFKRFFLIGHYLFFHSQAVRNLLVPGV